MSTFDTVFPADTLEFCPHSSAQNIFVCGTYNLDQPTQVAPPESLPEQAETDESPPPLPKPQPQHRQGKCLVFEVDPSPATPSSGGEIGFQKIQEISLPAVPDVKWCHTSPSTAPVLGVADSEGNVSIYVWRTEEKQLKHLDSISCASSDILCLSIDWSNRLSPGTELGSLVVSLSNGSLCLLRPDGHGSISVTDTWAAHDYEPWIAAWNYWNTNVIYSGGDDMKMKGWDTRQGFDQPLFVNKRFDAGVTTIQSHPYLEHIIAVGSYDNTVRLFDTRKPLVPLTQVDVGGGAWRVKWHPSPDRKDDLLVACMHDGFKVVRFNLNDQNSSQTGQVIKRFDQHTSLAYGVDWSFATTDSNSDSETLVGSCSFYDHALHLWRG